MWSLRPGTLADADALAATVVGAFAGYRVFAPDWEAPTFAVERAHAQRRLGQPDTWCRIAEAGGEIVGHIGYFAAPEPALAHLWQLFVHPDHWGTGLATTLLAAAIESATANGAYRAMRLYTPAGQARARRFYEREGWTAAGPTFFNDRLGLDVVEYRRARALSGSAGSHRAEPLSERVVTSRRRAPPPRRCQAGRRAAGPGRSRTHGRGSGSGRSRG